MVRKSLAFLKLCQIAVATLAWWPQVLADGAPMNAIVLTISALGLSMWDIGLHHGEFTRLALTTASHVAHAFGL